GELEAVEVRHAHIDEDECHLVLQQDLERLARRGRLEHGLADLGEHHLVTQQFRLLVVDQQDIDLVCLRHDSRRLTGAATCAGPTAAAECSRVSPDSPTPPPPDTFHDRPSWPWPS